MQARMDVVQAAHQREHVVMLRGRGTGMRAAPSAPAAWTAAVWLRADISEMLWVKTTKGYQLGVRPKEGATLNFLGFSDAVGAGPLPWPPAMAAAAPLNAL